MMRWIYLLLMMLLALPASAPLAVAAATTAAAESYVGCWLFTDFGDDETGVDEFRLEIKPATQKDLHEATLNIVGRYEEDDGKIEREKYPQVTLRCRPLKASDSAPEMMCANVDDDGGELRFSVSGGRARVSITNLDASRIDPQTKREVGVHFVAPNEDPYVSVTDKRCPKSGKKK